MPWRDYTGVIRRRWWIFVGLIALDLAVSGALYIKSTRHLGYQACTTLYVADVGSPGLISAPPTTLAAEGALLAGETAANFFADDILDVARSQHVAAFVSRQLASRHLPSTSEANIDGAISGSRQDRTISICASNPNSSSAGAIASGVAQAMTRRRALFVGPQMARRTYVDVVSNASVAPVSGGHERTNLLLRLILGVLVASGVALVVDALDPRIKSESEIERLTSAPVVRV